MSASKMEKRDNPEAENSLQYFSERKWSYRYDCGSILSIIQYFNRGVLHLLHRIPSKLDVSAHKPKHEAISLMDHKPQKIVNDLRLISSETNLAYYTENFVFSALHKDRPDNQDDGNF